jgi:hypothetical protein
MHLGFVSTEDNAEEIIDNLCASGLCEVFVFKSAQNYGSAPELVAHWTGADGYFGNESEDERLQEHEWHGRGIHSP